MNCEQCEVAIGELVDGTRLDEATRIDVEAHLRDCEDCRDLLADLRRIHAAAGHLPVHPVPDRAWSRVSAQLPAGARSGRRVFETLFGSARLKLAWGAAAALVVVVLATGVLLPKMRPGNASQSANRAAFPAQSQSPSATVHPNDKELVQSVESELRQAEQHYEKAIAGLEQMTKAGEGTLDPQLAGTLQKNLAVIDQAIHDSRLALDTQPTNEQAQESLFEAFRRKVGLLQDTVALMNEMRKGNEAGAAKIIGNMNKS